MSSFIASKVIKLMIKKGIKINDARILILGVTFKENCPDIRNTKKLLMLKKNLILIMHLLIYMILMQIKKK